MQLTSFNRRDGLSTNLTTNVGGLVRAGRVLYLDHFVADLGFLVELSSDVLSVDGSSSHNGASIEVVLEWTDGQDGKGLGMATHGVNGGSFLEPSVSSLGQSHLNGLLVEINGILCWVVDKRSTLMRRNQSHQTQYGDMSCMSRPRPLTNHNRSYRMERPRRKVRYPAERGDRQTLVHAYMRLHGL